MVALQPSVRLLLVGTLPDPYAYSIAAQGVWLSLIAEVVYESILMPSYANFNEKNLSPGDILLPSLGVLTVLTVLILISLEWLSLTMRIPSEIMDDSILYMSFEALSYIPMGIIALIISYFSYESKQKQLIFLIGFKITLAILCDMVILNIKNDVVYLGLSSMLSSYITLIIAILMIGKPAFIKTGNKENYISIAKRNFLTGVESLIRNLFYVLMISRMVNIVGEAGTYWEANGIIWSFLLPPALAYAEFIRRRSAKYQLHIYNKTRALFAGSMIYVVVFVIMMSLFIVSRREEQNIYNVLIFLTIPYIFFIFQNNINSVFYGLGRIDLVLFQSLVINVIYYGLAFLLYLLDIWKPSLFSITWLFGIGMILGGLFDCFLYLWQMKKSRIPILNDNV